MSPEKTQQLLTNSLAADPHDWEVRRHLIESLLSQGQAAAAAEVVRAAPGLPTTVEDAQAAIDALYEVDAEEAQRYADALPEMEDPSGAVEAVGEEGAVAVSALAPPPGIALAPPEPVVAIAPPPPVTAPPPPPVTAPSAGHMAPPVTPPPLGGSVAMGVGAGAVAGGHEDEDWHGRPVPPVAKRTTDRATAALVAVGVHAAVALLLVFIVVAMPAPKPPEITAVTAPVSATTDLQKKQVATQTPKQPSAPPTANTQIITSTNMTAVSVPTVDVPTDSLNDIGSDFGSGMSFSGSGMGAAGAGAPFVMKSRCAKTERIKMLQQHGGSIEVENAVERGLSWLKQNQNPDGSWGRGEYKAAMTGLALLCFLGHCETPDSPKYGDDVLKALLWLVELAQRQNGYFTENQGNNHFPYEHGIATYAMGETYALARMGQKQLPGVREAFERGVELIIDGQHTNGGWRYSYGASADVSVTAWQYQALKAAQHTKLSFSGLTGSMRNARGYIESMQDRSSGGIGYTSPNEPKFSMTAAGVLGLQLLGGSNTSRINSGLDYMIGNYQPDWGSANLYAWYYAQQAFFQSGGDRWKMWNDAVMPMLLANQTPQGNWTKGGGAGVDAGIYGTTLCILMLEVYYRYLPAAG
jgi:hypothetical protein